MTDTMIVFTAHIFKSTYIKSYYLSVTNYYKYNCVYILIVDLYDCSHLQTIPINRNVYEAIFYNKMLATTV